MTALIAAALLAAAFALLQPGAGSRHRLTLEHTPAADSGRGRHRAPALAASVGLALGVFVLFGGAVGMILGVGAGAVAFRQVARLDDGGAAKLAQELAGQAADIADMLAACVASGAGLERATKEVAGAVPEPGSKLLAEAAAALALGAAGPQAWAGLAAHESTAPIARAVIRSLESGAPMADALTSCARELREIRRSEIETLAQSVTVKSVGPLGLCFLPAFLLTGVVPLVAGLLARTMQQW